MLHVLILLSNSNAFIPMTTTTTTFDVVCIFVRFDGMKLICRLIFGLITIGFVLICLLNKFESSSSLNNQLKPRHCRIEVFGGFEGVEQSYISGVLFRDIRSICSCYLHYQSIDQFSISSWQFSRIVWCILKCPIDVIEWCRNHRHRSYCQKNVILFDLFDENLDYPIEHYSYFASVYRNYLRFDSRNQLTYLTNDLKQLLEINQLKLFHRTLNWTLAIEIMKQEWAHLGFHFNNISHRPNANIRNEIDRRIVQRILIDNENISYHTWPNLDKQINSNVFWFPLGFTTNYLYKTVEFNSIPLSQRKRLWSWIGSTKLNERNDLLNRFQSNDSLTRQIKQQGFLFVTDREKRNLIEMNYTSILLDSQFVPLPRGYSPEQYRSFELIQSGAFPIVNRRWTQIKRNLRFEPLAYLNVLGYDPPTLNHFNELPYKLFELSHLPNQLLDNWQSIMLFRHRIIINTLTKHIANRVCQTNNQSRVARF